MKSFTDIEQSKQLADILPIESADMLFQLGEDKYADSIRVTLTKEHWEQMMPDINPCWSLSALLDVFRKIDDNVEIWNNHEDWFVDVAICETTSRDLLDACVAMVQILHEKKIINFNNKED